MGQLIWFKEICLTWRTCTWSQTYIACHSNQVDLFDSWHMTLGLDVQLNQMSWANMLYYYQPFEFPEASMSRQVSPPSFPSFQAKEECGETMRFNLSLLWIPQDKFNCWCMYECTGPVGLPSLPKVFWSSNFEQFWKAELILHWSY